MSFTAVPLVAPLEKVFPTLSEAQIERIKARGRAISFVHQVLAQ